MRVIAVIPALNEYHRLQQVVQQVRSFVSAVVIVDDGSGTPLIEHLPPMDSVTVIRHAINLGKGAALKTGTMWALERGYEVAVYIDADGQHDPQEIPALVTPIADGDIDIVFGVRKFHQAMPFMARFGNRLLTIALRMLYHINVTDTQSGYRAVRLSAYPRLQWDSPRYAVETEMIVNTGKHNLKYAEVPIRTIYHDKYKGTTVIDGVRIMINMIAWRFL